jgi:pimeloyl-ACP methyl ester carboxylesterase
VTDVRFARSGDVHVAYHVVGEGPVDLVYAQGAYTHLEIEWELPAFRRYCERLAEFTRLILFDKRGMGMSDRVPGATTLEERMDDVGAVMDAVGSERAAVMGESEGSSASADASSTPRATAFSPPSTARRVRSVALCRSLNRSGPSASRCARACTRAKSSNWMPRSPG